MRRPGLPRGPSQPAGGTRTGQVATCASPSAGRAETHGARRRPRCPRGTRAHRPLVPIRRRQPERWSCAPRGPLRPLLRGRLGGGGDLLCIFTLHFRDSCSGAVRSAAATRRKLPPPNRLRAPVSCRRRDLQSQGARLGDPDPPGAAPVAGRRRQGPSRGTRAAGLPNLKEPRTHARDATWTKGDGTETRARATWVKGPQHLREVAAHPRAAWDGGSAVSGQSSLEAALERLGRYPLWDRGVDLISPGRGQSQLTCPRRRGAHSALHI